MCVNFAANWTELKACFVCVWDSISVSIDFRASFPGLPGGQSLFQLPTLVLGTSYLGCDGHVMVM